MAVRDFGNKRNAASTNYTIRRLSDGTRLFATDCAAGDAGAIQMVRQKDSPAGKFKAGDTHYVKGANSAFGTLKYVGVQEGFSAPSKNLVIGLADKDEATGVEAVDFVSIPVIREKGGYDQSAGRLLSALELADVGEPVQIVVHTFKHKAGESRGLPDGSTYEKDGEDYVFSLYQDHLKTVDNPNGKLVADKDSLYRQTRRVVDGATVTELKQGERAAAGATVVFDHKEAVAHVESVVKKITGLIHGNKPADFAVPVIATELHTDDTEFGEGADDHATVSTGQRVR